MKHLSLLRRRCGAPQRAGFKLVLISALFVGGTVLQAAPDKQDPGLAAPGGRLVPRPSHAELRRVRLRKVALLQGRIHFRYARSLLGAGRLKSALRSLQDFLVLYPRHPWRFEALRETARVLEKQSRFRRAARTYVAAYRSRRNRDMGLQAYLRAGRIYAEIGKLPRARKIFKDLIRLRPRSRIARLAEIEMQSLRFLDEKSSGRKLERPKATEDRSRSTEERPGTGKGQKGVKGAEGKTGEKGEKDVPGKKSPAGKKSGKSGASN